MQMTVTALSAATYDKFRSAMQVRQCCTAASVTSYAESATAARLSVIIALAALPFTAAVTGFGLLLLLCIAMTHNANDSQRPAAYNSNAGLTCSQPKP